jgi:hypothetical protein
LRISAAMHRVLIFDGHAGRQPGRLAHVKTAWHTCRTRIGSRV